EHINYYYLGYLIHGTISRMSAVPTWIGFNLALATTVSTTIVAAVGIGYDAVVARLGRSLAVAAGVLAAFFVMISGNMLTPVRLLQDPRSTWDAWWWQGVGWQASRVVVDNGAVGHTSETINEFPSFSLI